MPCQFRIGNHSLECPIGLLLAGNYFKVQAGGIANGANQILSIFRVTSGARGDDANGNSSGAFGSGGKCCHGGRGFSDGSGLQDVTLVKTTAKAGLLTVFKDGNDVA